MALDLMKYKNYTWHHNPSKINISSQRNIKEIIMPFSGAVFQDYGRRKRIVSGEGEFYGIDCIEQFNSLFSIFSQDSEGYLTLPGIQSFLALFHRLELLGETAPNVVTYKFEFWEVLNESDQNVKSWNTNYHIVRNGETLWDIAQKYNLDITKLLKLNLEIKNPNTLYANERVKLY